MTFPQERRETWDVHGDFLRAHSFAVVGVVHQRSLVASMVSRPRTFMKLIFMSDVCAPPALQQISGRSIPSFYVLRTDYFVSSFNTMDSQQRWNMSFAEFDPSLSGKGDYAPPQS